MDIYLFIFSSYIAVSGVPTEVEEHALIMADFSLELLLGFDRVLNRKKLEGIDVENIGIRIGLHSGPVTAGVLRGGKCIYQLYGATVYEANRMEQTGRAGSVHVSYETAQLLRMGCWQHIIIERNDIPRSDDHAADSLQKRTYWIYRDEDVVAGQKKFAIINTNEESKRNGWMRAVTNATPRHVSKSEKSGRHSSQGSVRLSTISS